VAPWLDDDEGGSTMAKHIETVDLACSLTDEELRSRRVMAREALVPYIIETEKLTDGLKITFHETTAVRSSVETFAALERQCCGFLTLTVTPPGEGLTLSIKGPPEAQAIIGMFLAEFDNK
jgi:hypothetical protein